MRHRLGNIRECAERFLKEMSVRVQKSQMKGSSGDIRWRTQSVRSGRCHSLIQIRGLNMKQIIFLLPFAVALFSISGSAALAQLDYDESVSGDLSGSLTSPTELIFDTGVNVISGNIGSDDFGGATNGTDADYFWFSLGEGESIDSIVTTRTGSGTQSFIGYAAGVAFTGQGAGDVDEFALFSDGESLLPGELLSTPLTTGNHAFWLQETSGSVDYSISFNVVSSVPEPSSAIALVGLGFAGLVRRRRDR